MAATVPGIEITDEADAASRWRPNGEVNARDAVHCFEVRAKLFVGVVVAALGHQMKVEVAELIWKRIGIVNFEGNALVRAALDFVAARLRRSGLARRPSCLEKAF